MKKYLLFAGVAVVALTSCQNEEVVDISNSDAITFRTASALNDVTRGAEISNANINQFLSTAVEQTLNGGGNLFEDVIFRKQNGSTEFKSDQSYLWYKDANLKFYAWSYYSPVGTVIDNSKVGTVSINTSEAKIKDFSPQPQIENQIDLVGATAQATYDSNRAGAVSLDFTHLLSEIQVLAKANNDTYVFKVKGVKFCNVKDQATYDFNASSWTINDETPLSTYEVTYTDPIVLNETKQNISATATKGYAMLIPQQKDTWDVVNDPGNIAKAPYLAVLLQITVNDDSGYPLQVFPLVRKDENGNIINNNKEFAWACIPIGDTWLSGHRITYVLDFTNGAGYTDPDPEEDPDSPNPDPGKPILDGQIKCIPQVDEWIEDPDLYPNTVGTNTKNHLE